MIYPRDQVEGTNEIVIETVNGRVTQVMDKDEYFKKVTMIHAPHCTLWELETMLNKMGWGIRKLEDKL